jgi:hypothetical protein
MSHQVHAVRCRVSGVGYQLSAISFQLSAMGCLLTALSFPVAGSPTLNLQPLCPPPSPVPAQPGGTFEFTVTVNPSRHSSGPSAFNPASANADSGRLQPIPTFVGTVGLRPPAFNRQPSTFNLQPSTRFICPSQQSSA